MEDCEQALDAPEEAGPHAVDAVEVGAAPGVGGYLGVVTDTGAIGLARDLGPVLHRTVQDGAAHESGVVPDELRRAVLDEVGAESFADLAAVEGPYGVCQDGEHRVFTGEEIGARPAVHALHRAVVAAVQAHGDEIAGLGDWRPDEVAVQRYPAGSGGISTHRDGRRHRYLVAILTLEGSARLRQCSDRKGTTVRTWEAAAGSLVLLRGPGLAGTEDGRPLHAVDGPIEYPRTSFSLRMTGR